MSFIDDFSESASSRLASVTFAIAASLGLSGCLATAPVRTTTHVLQQNGTALQRDFHTELRREVVGATRLTPCPTGNAGTAAVPAADPNAGLGTRLTKRLQREVTPTTTVIVGTPADCPKPRSSDGVQPRQPR